MLQAGDAVRDLSTPVDPQVAEFEESMLQACKFAETQFKPVADLYALCWKRGDVVTYTPEPEKAAIWLNNYSGTCVQEYVRLERLQESISGNSPVTPDGYVLVPIVPTEDMIINGFESVPDPHFSDEKEWKEYEALSGCRQAARRAELCWAAMIKAAPKQENI